MVIASVSADHSQHLMGEVQGLLTLKVCSREHHGRVLRIRSAKCTIGSHPSCTLRLCATGVRPFHCVILRGLAGTFVRRWSGETCLNGASFKDTRLRPGDRLNIGPIELEILGVSADRDSEPPRVPNSGSVATGWTPSSPDLSLPPSCNAPGDQAPTSQSPGSDCGESTSKVECKRHQAQGICEECRSEREELEHALALRAIQSDQHRSKLAEQCAALSGDLKKSEIIRKCLVRDSEKLNEQRVDEQTGYRELIESLRHELNELKVRHASQLTEQENLVVQAAEAQRQVTQLEGELQALRRQASELDAEAARSEVGLAEELAQREQQLAESRQQLDRERNEAERHKDQAEATRQKLESLSQELQSGQQAVGTAQQERDSARQELELLQQKQHESQQCQDAAGLELDRLNQELRSAQQAVDKAEQERDSARQEFDALRQELDRVSAQADSFNQETSGQLPELRQQLDEAAEQLLASEDRGAELQSQLEQLREQSQQALEVDRLHAEEVQRRNDELEAARTEYETERKQWEEQWERSELAEKQLRDQLQEASKDLQEATQSLETARVRSVELERLLSETSQELVHHEDSDRSIQREKEESEREVSKWRDLVDCARKELQQEREEHQRVRNEWHVERESVQRELAERSTALEELQRKHSQEMEEAEFLILSLQQEGKQLLAQLDEAKQAIRRDSDKRKRPETSGQKQVNAADAVQQTMLMPSRLENEQPPAEDEPEQPDSVELEGHDLETTQAPDQQPMATPSETPEPEVAVAAGNEQTGDLTEQSVADSPEASRLDQTMVLPRDDSVDEPAGIASRSDDADEAQNLALQTLHLDPVELQRQAKEMQVDELPEMEITEGVSALFSAAQISPDQDPESSDDEGVIQQYMERLLKRVASHGGDEAEVHAEPTSSQSTAVAQQSTPVSDEKPVDQSEVEKSEVDNVVAAASSSGAAAPNLQEHAADDTAAADKQSTPSPAPRPKEEIARDLLAMRELANDSARNAIQSSEHRRFSALAFGELTVATVCLISAGLAIAMSPSKFSPQMAGGAIGVVFGLIMFLRGLLKFFSCRRLKRDRKNVDPAQDEV